MKRFKKTGLLAAPRYEMASTRSWTNNRTATKFDNGELH